MTDDEPHPTELPNYGSCPACGYVFDDDTLDDADTEVTDGRIVTRFECLDCDRRLRLVVESAAPDALGVDMTLEVDE